MALDAKISTKGKTSQADWIELYNGSDQPINLLATVCRIRTASFSDDIGRYHARSRPISGC